MQILVVTVGGRIEPIVAEIGVRTPRFDRVIFLCSADLPTAKGSWRSVDAIAEQSGLAPDQHETVQIEQFDDLQECYQQAQSTLARLRREYPDAEIVANYTGGTKSMTAGLVLAAMDFPEVQLSLVTGTRADQVAVRSGTEYSQPVIVWDVRARRRLQEAGRRVAEYDYAGAAEDLNEICHLNISETMRARVRAARDVCRALDAWDRFRHAHAAEELKVYRGQLQDDEWKLRWAMLDDLLRNDRAIDKYLMVKDLLLNAERRVAQGRYDDAVARVYRSLELLAQLRLRHEYGIDTSDVDLDRLPESARARLDEGRSKQDGKIQVGLLPAWNLLLDLGDPLLGEWYRRHQSRLLNWLKMRNESILAHGLTPIGPKEFEREGRVGLELCRDALSTLTTDKKQSVQAVQLPESLALLQ